LTPISERRYNLGHAGPESLHERLDESARRPTKGRMMARFSAAAALFAFFVAAAAPAAAQDDGGDATDAAPTATMSAPADDAGDEPVDVDGSDAAGDDGVELRRELRTVEEGVSSLKERVFRSKATLKLLKELVVEGAAAGSRVVVWHVNQLGGGYSMESAQYFLDGKNVFSKVDPGGTLDTVREIKVHEQTVPPGKHTVQVNYVLRGKGYKVFSYLRSYQFKVQSSYTFDVREGALSIIRVVADSKGGLRNFVERPTVLYDERSDTIREE